MRSLANLYSIHVAPDGENVYVVSQKHITTFDRDPVTGNVTARTGTTACLSIDGDLESTAGNDNLCTAAGGTNIMKRMVFAPNSNHVYVGGAYNTQRGHTDAITLFDRAADGTLTRRATPTAKDGCIAWTNGPLERRLVPDRPRDRPDQGMDDLPRRQAALRHRRPARDRDHRP